MKAFILVAAIALLPAVSFSQSIDYDKLIKKGDIYYHPTTNKPYTGQVKRAHCTECGGPFETFEMKNGKIHGAYSMSDHGDYISGYYKDGKKDGIWKLCGEYDVCEMESYKDGVKQVLTKEMERAQIVKDSLEIEKKIQQAKQSATEFLQKNKSAAGVVSTKSGLQYKILTKGSGNTAKEGDTATVHYTLTFLDGTKLISTYDRQFPQPIVLHKGAGVMTTGIMQGQVEMLLLMKKGDKVKAWLPSNIAYGDQYISADPRYSLFILDMELLDFKTALCNRKPYNSETQFCYKEALHNKCGGQQYNPDIQICSSNKVLDKCGDLSYDQNTHFCNYTDKKVYAKCAGQQYSPEMQVCKDNKVQFKYSCDGQPYSPQMQFCDGNTIKMCDTTKLQERNLKIQTAYRECLQTTKDTKKCTENYTAQLQEPCANL